MDTLSKRQLLVLRYLKENPDTPCSDIPAADPHLLRELKDAELIHVKVD